MQVNRRLYRCRHDRRIAGVASGLAEYFDADPTVVRLLWVASFLFGGVGLLLYIAMAIVVPLEPEGDVVPSEALPATHRHATRGGGRATTWFGAILILFGALALVNMLLPAWADGGHFLWPAFILGIGVLLVATSMRRESSDMTEPTQPIEPTQT
jgi:phage shock protein C